MLAVHGGIVHEDVDRAEVAGRLNPKLARDGARHCHIGLECRVPFPAREATTASAASAFSR